MGQRKKQRKKKPDHAGGGGSLSGLRTGFRGLVGRDKKTKPSGKMDIWNIILWIAVAIALIVFLWRRFG